MESISRVFWGPKKGSKFKRIFERILESLGGYREPRLGLRLQVPRGKARENVARRRPTGGGRIEPAEPEPPPAPYICKVG